MPSRSLTTPTSAPCSCAASRTPWPTFSRNIENSEADFNNRLIEVFGYPYQDDCGPGRTYATDYCQNGPDLYHYMYVDPSELMGVEAPRVHQWIQPMMDIER